MAEFLSKEATSNDDFSISKISTNLAGVEAEQDLRSSLVRRLAKGFIYSGSGNIFMLEEKQSASLLATATGTVVNSPTTLCYYCLLRDESEEERESTSGQSADEGPSPEYVVCLLKTFDTADVELDLFRNEMDAFCEQFVASGLLRSVNSDSLGAIEAHLSTWYDATVEYLPRCCELFASDLDVMLYATVVGRKIEVKGTPRQAADVSSFVHALSLATLLGAPGMLHKDPHTSTTLAPLSLVFTSERDSKHSSTTTPTPGAATPTPAPTPAPATDRVYTLSGERMSVPFCRAWAAAMATAMVASSAAFALKQLIHAHELKIIQEINTMKRLVCQAAGSHYALYNTYHFICSCETVPSVVLTSALTSAAGEDVDDDTREVLDVLLAFIRGRTKVSGLSINEQEQLREAMTAAAVHATGPLFPRAGPTPHATSAAASYAPSLHSSGSASVSTSSLGQFPRAAAAAAPVVAAVSEA